MSAARIPRPRGRFEPHAGRVFWLARCSERTYSCGTAPEFDRACPSSACLVGVTVHPPRSGTQVSVGQEVAPAAFPAELEGDPEPRQRGERRLGLFGIAVGWLLHLVADGMWQAPETFLWPAFGTEFAAAPPEPYSWDLLTDPLGHLATWAGELAGLAVLAWFWVAFELGRDRRWRAFLADGYLRP